MLSVDSFTEDVSSASNYPEGPLRTKETGYCRALQISQLQAKHLTATCCQFGAHFSEAMGDPFFCGLQNKEMEMKLLKEEHNFDKALKNALSVEAAEKDVAAFSHKGLKELRHGQHSLKKLAKFIKFVVRNLS